MYFKNALRFGVKMSLEATEVQIEILKEALLPSF